MALTQVQGGMIGSLPTGSVLQVINGTASSSLSNSTNTFVDTGLTATITPKFSTSKILIIISHSGVGKDTSNTDVVFRVLRGVTQIANISGIGYTNSTVVNYPCSVVLQTVDSPATTSATTYKTQFASDNNTGIAYVNNTFIIPTTANNTSVITLMEIAQ